jgi:hypothetical protein
MNVHFAERGLKIVEVPITVRYDVPNGHKQKPIKHGLSVMARIVSYLGYKHPLMVFGIPGLILFILGLTLCVEAFSEQIILFDWSLATQGIAGVSALSISIFLMFSALILNSLGLLMQNIQFAARDNRK